MRQKYLKMFICTQSLKFKRKKFSKRLHASFKSTMKSQFPQKVHKQTATSQKSAYQVPSLSILSNIYKRKRTCSKYPEFPRCRARRFPERSRRTDGSATLAGSPPAPRCAFAQPYLNGESMLCYLFRSVITMFRRDLGIGRCNVWVGV